MISESYVSPDCANLEPSDRRHWTRLWAAYTLVSGLAALLVTAPDATREDGFVDLGEAFEAKAQRVRGGEAAVCAAGEYFLRQAPGSGRDVIARILNVAAQAGSRKEAVQPLVNLCASPMTIRATTTRVVIDPRDGRPVRAEHVGPHADREVSLREAGDRMNRIQPRYWETLGRGARLLALRGDRRCLQCHGTVGDFRRDVGGAISDRQLRSDYCSVCISGLWDIPPEDEYAVRKILKEAAPAILFDAPWKSAA